MARIDMITPIIDELKNRLGTNLVLIISIGSFGKDEFNDALSDLDFIIVLDTVNYLSLKLLKHIQNHFTSLLNRKIDFKPYSLLEFWSSFDAVNESRFTDGWGTQMIIDKFNKIEYSRSDVHDFIFLNSRPISSSSLRGIENNIEKFRKILVSNIHLSHGEFYTMTAKDMSKLALSCTTTILKLALAYNEIFVSSLNDAIKKGCRKLKDIDFSILQAAYDLKKQGLVLSESQCIDLYALCCRIQQAVLMYHKKLRTQKYIIIIGGTSGVGKTSCAKELCHYGYIDHRIGTGFIREIIRSIIPKGLNPELHEYTFRSAKELLASFISQSAILKNGLGLILSRAKKEGTSLVVEGTHLIPGDIPVDIADFFVILAVSDKSELARRMRGSTHKFREISCEDVDTSWRIQEYLIEKAKIYGVPIIYSDKENAVSYILSHFKNNVVNTFAVETNPVSENQK